MPALTNISTLRANVSPTDSGQIIQGYASAGDGGGGTFVRVPGDTSADNGVTIIVDAVGNRWHRLYSGDIDVRWAGARCDGRTDDSDAIARASAIGPIMFGEGVCLLNRTMRIASHARAWPGRIRVGTGKTVTFGAGFCAPRAPVFLNATVAQGIIAFHHAALEAPFGGYPEWWGAKADDGSFDNVPALTACVAACAVTHLAAADYWLQQRWLVSTSRRRIVGVGRNGDGQSPVTRVIGHSATDDVFMVGTDKEPPNINAFVQYVDVENVTFVSDAAPVAPPSGMRGGPSCVRGQYVLNCTFTHVTVINGTNGFYFTGAVYSELNACAAQRLGAGTTKTNDYYIGCMLDGSESIGANTGISSFYIRKFSVSGTTHALANYGVYSADGFTDMFIDSVETVGVQYGVILNGKPSVTYGSEDCKVFNCVLDQVHAGIRLNGGSASTAAVVTNNYVALASSPAGGTGIEIASTPISGMGGSISLIGNQIIGGGGKAIGFAVTASSGVESVGNILTDLNAPIVLTHASHCRIADRISNPTQTANTAAIVVTDSYRVTLDCYANGKSRAFPAGIVLSGAANEVVEARTTGIDPRSVAGGAANLLISDGTPVTGAGPFGTNSLAHGIMA